MKSDSNHRIYDEMKTELQQLEQRLEQLKARMEEANPTPPRARFRMGARLVALRGLAAVGCVALLISLLAAGASQSLTIDPSGVVKVGALQLDGKDLGQTLSGLRQDVDSKLPLAGGTLASDLTVGGKIAAGNSDIYFTRTDHNHSAAGNKDGNAAIENAKDYDGLMILGRQSTAARARVVRLWDVVGIGGSANQGPQSQLDVKGEIRGKPWYTSTYSVDWNAGGRDVKMTRTDHSVCFLTGIRGGWAGGGEQVWIEAGSDNYWHLKVNQGSAGRDLLGLAICIGAPDSSW
ncbi:MAG TPA: hypothetical protein VGL22_15235 [Terracidiphilus sp.]